MGLYDFRQTKSPQRARCVGALVWNMTDEPFLDKGCASYSGSNEYRTLDISRLSWLEKSDVAL
jgi:hypothetical protein